MIPLSVPNISGNEWNYIRECLDSGWVSSLGRHVDLFEERLADFTGSKHAIAVVNGTAALHLALLAAGLEPDDEVLVPSISFIAPINAVRYCGAWPVFMDCDEYYCIDPGKTRKFVEQECRFEGGKLLNRRTGRKVWGILPVHVFGHPVDMDAVVSLAGSFNLEIVEDAAESLGSFFRKKHTGTFGRCGGLSFNGNKIITTGGGGAVLTDDDAAAERIRYLSTQAKDDSLHFVHGDVGYNYRLTSIQAAMGMAQMERLAEFIETKRRNFEHYAAGLEEISGLSLCSPPPGADPNYWFYCLQIDESRYPRKRDELMAFLLSKGIQSRPVWYPNHLQKMFTGCEAYEIERVLSLHEKTVNIPCSTNLSESEVNEVLEALKI